MDNDRDLPPDGHAEFDLVWPPTTEDLDACEVVPLIDDGLDRGALAIGGFPMRETDPRLRPHRPGVFTLPVNIGGFPLRVQAPAPLMGAAAAVPPPLPPPIPAPVPPPLPAPVVPAAVAAAEPAAIDPAELEHIFTGSRPWVVEHALPQVPAVAMGAALPETSSVGPRARAVLALAVAASLALLSWSQFRALGRNAQPDPESVVRLEASQPTTGARAPVAEPVPVETQPAAFVEPVVETVRPVERPAVITKRPIQPARPAPRPRAPQVARNVSAPVPMRLDLAAKRAVPAPVPVPAAAPPPPPVAVPALAVATSTRETPIVSVTEERMPSEEDNVRSTLARWRNAYSQLDARAAKHVYPGLNVRALERAFQELKSQDVRFDRCELTMGDETAQASCTGRATFVPRIGSQSPITTPRQWRFELKRFDEGWTIASARSSQSSI